MAQVAAVYTVLLHVRTSESIMKIENEGSNIEHLKPDLIKRENIDKCADYLLKNKLRLQYGKAIKNGCRSFTKHATHSSMFSFLS